MVPQWIIEKKRDGHALSDDELKFFIQNYTDGTLPDYQMAALAMAIVWRGMTAAEIAGLTRAMRDSGNILPTAGLSAPVVDKHSTGGIGDKISIILAPLAAACGLMVPMISGRGLGITGGTLDKLESIPGYRVDLSEAEMLRVLDACGCCMAGQTANMAPADKKIYALRDVTGTVPSIPLITASILSKKLAAGLHALVLDVKTGSGAFMQSLEAAEQLAEMLLNTGRELGLRVSALISDMNQPLGRAVGNALEMQESLEVLRGVGPEDVRNLTLELVARMLLLGGKVSGREEGLALAHTQLDSGAACQHFQQMVKLHGGDTRFLTNPELWSPAPLRETVPAARGGYICRMDAGKIGRASLLLGAGRTKTTDKVDHAVGFSELKKIGEPIEKNAPLAIIHARDQVSLAGARTLLEEAVEYSDTPVKASPLIIRSL